MYEPEKWEVFLYKRGRYLGAHRYHDGDSALSMALWWEDQDGNHEARVFELVEVRR